MIIRDKNFTSHIINETVTYKRISPINIYEKKTLSFETNKREATVHAEQILFWS